MNPVEIVNAATFIEPYVFHSTFDDVQPVLFNLFHDF